MKEVKRKIIKWIFFMKHRNFFFLDVSLTRSCNYSCSYCNQRYLSNKKMYDLSDSKRIIVSNKTRSAHEWIQGLNNFPYKNLYEKIILSGGEPSCHKGFFDIIRNIKGYNRILIVSNLSFDVDKLIFINKHQLTPITLQPSFHYEFAQIDEFIEKLRKLKKARLISNFIPVSIVDLPDKPELKEYRDRFIREGFLASLYTFEGYYKGNWYYADQEAFGGLGSKGEIECSSCMHYVKPNGDLTYCATDTYKENPKDVYGNICDQNYKNPPKIKRCDRFGLCHITSASWITVKQINNNITLWHGKNYKDYNLKNKIRFSLEKRNYFWLSNVKSLSDRIKGWRTAK